MAQLSLPRFALPETVFGDQQRFAIQLRKDAQCLGDTPVGTCQFWLAGQLIGQAQVRECLIELLSWLKELAAMPRQSRAFDGLGTQASFDYLHYCVFGAGRRADFSRFVFLPMMKSFREHHLFCVESDGQARLIAAANGLKAWELNLAASELQDVMNAAINHLASQVQAQLPLSASAASIVYKARQSMSYSNGKTKARLVGRASMKSLLIRNSTASHWLTYTPARSTAQAVWA